MLTIEKFTVNPLQENCYIVADETLECVIIDCGAYTLEERKEIVDYIKANNLQPKHHLLTHYHTDHCIGCDTVFDAFGLLPEVHIDEKPLVEMKDEMCEYILGEPLSKNFPEVGRFFTEKDTIAFGNHVFSILLTPGHSCGSVFFLSKKEKIAFSGDTLFRGGIGRTDFVGGSMFQIIQSLRRICQLDDDIKLFPGHGESTTIGYECATNPFIER